MAIFIYVLILLLFFSWIDYPTKSAFIHILPNIGILLFVLIFLVLLNKIKYKSNMSNYKYFKYIKVITVITFILQILLCYFCCFQTGWDVYSVERNANIFISTGSLYDVGYLTRYPNNVFITFIVVILKQLQMHLPFVTSDRHVLLLIINCMLVNASCLIASLTIRNLTKDNRLSILSYIITIPLIILSPWILIVYTDTFSIIFPILIIYLYSKDNKSKLNLFLIVFLSVLGYYIKPTVIIVLMALIIVEIIHFKPKQFNIKNTIISTILIIIGILIPFGISKYANYYLNFKPLDNVYEFNLKHYLAMGQNNDTCGVYSQSDVNNSIKNGMDANIDIFIDRITNRTPLEQLIFFSKKTLINFNSGSFFWGGEGGFYINIPESKSKLQDFIRSIVYSNQDNNKYLLQVEQYIWLFVLIMCPFIIRKSNNKNELVIMLSLIGITLFLTIFEARTRYFFLYSPVFVTCAMLGIKHIKELMDKKFKN
jgi:hypothetical protein